MSAAAPQVQVVCWPHTSIVEEYNIFLKAQELLADILPSRTLHAARRLSTAVRHARAAQDTKRNSKDGSRGAAEDADDATPTCMAALSLPASLMQCYLQQQEAESGSAHADSDDDSFCRNSVNEGAHRCSASIKRGGNDAACIASSSLSSSPPPSHGHWLTVQPALEYASVTHGPLHAITWPQWEELRALYHAEHSPTPVPVTVDATASAAPCMLVEVVLLWFHEGIVHRVTPAELVAAEKRAGIIGAARTAAAADEDPPSSCAQSPPAALPSRSILLCCLELEYPPGILLSRKLPVPLTEPLLTRLELIELIRRTANVRKHYPLRVAYRVWPHESRALRILKGVGPHRDEAFSSRRRSSRNRIGMGEIHRSASGDACTLTPAAPPARAIESDQAVRAFVRDTLTYGSAAVRVVAVQSARGALPSSLTTTALKGNERPTMPATLDPRDGATATRPLAAESASLQSRTYEEWPAAAATSTETETETETASLPASRGETNNMVVEEVKSLGPASPAAVLIPSPAALYTVDSVQTQKDDSNRACDTEGGSDKGGSRSSPPSPSPSGNQIKCESLLEAGGGNAAHPPAALVAEEAHDGSLREQQQQQEYRPASSPVTLNGVAGSAVNCNEPDLCTNSTRMNADSNVTAADNDDGSGAACMPTAGDSALHDAKGGAAALPSAVSTEKASTAVMLPTNDTLKSSITPSLPEMGSRHSDTRRSRGMSHSDDDVRADEPQRHHQNAGVANPDEDVPGESSTAAAAVGKVSEDERVMDNLSQQQQQQQSVDDDNLGEAGRCPVPGERAAVEPQQLPSAVELNSGASHSILEVTKKSDVSSNSKPLDGMWDRSGSSVGNDEALAAAASRSQNKGTPSCSDPVQRQATTPTHDGKCSTTCMNKEKGNTENSSAIAAATAPVALIPSWPYQKRTSRIRSSVNPQSMVFVRCEVNPTAVYVWGPVSQAALHQLEDVIFRRCCAHLSSDETALRPRFHVHQTNTVHVNVNSTQSTAPRKEAGARSRKSTDNDSNTLGITSASTWSQVEYMMPLHAYRFTPSEENALERCIAEVMAVYQGLEQLPAKEAEEWALATSFGAVSPSPAH
ncbi:hypothetical protein ABL78_1320 [Leptomonas seymouri]|uniref:Uncharacterized protein n=1 Tax=Leptomonas seymouri TaxID=5684 RepID=A0A0N1I0T6_LEPSE|nr:hypothetical protein ABL78_1320 [Leptomonas seymouri]|eukprot:KPI89552.1 hypothetical protein ABL78_1320 [Leptomonas seymouri]